jgi:hypothetical protein
MENMTREQLLAAEIFAYSFDNYANHLGIGHLRFEKYMPDTVRLLERAEREGWTEERLAKAMEVEKSEVSAWQQRYRDAVKIVDATTPAAAFRHAVRQALIFEFQRHKIGEAEIESAVQQVCYRAADLSYLLDRQNEKLSDYSQELRSENDSGTQSPQEPLL